MNRWVIVAVLAGAASGDAAAQSKKGPTPPLQTAPESALKGIARTKRDHPTPTPAQRARRERSRKQLAALKAPFNAHLPVVEDARTVAPRTPREIADRAVAVAIAAVKAEGVEQKAIDDLVKRMGAEGLFTPEERAFLRDPAPSDQTRAKFSWRYEGLEVLLWALGFKDALPPADQIMDVRAAVGIIRDQGRAGLVANAKPRSVDALLDANDLYYCLDWAAVELRLRGETHPALNGEIIVERHYALNWLIRYMNQEWDHVTTDT